MKILLEQYGYQKEVLAKLLDSHYYSELQNGTAQITYVGYFLSHKIPDTVFILPKVFIIDGKAFGKYTPENVIDFEILEEDDKRAIFALSTWIYRAIKLYLKRKSLYANSLEVMQNVVSHHGANSETMIDIVLSLLRFNKEHQNLFTYITRLHHSGQNKIHWQKTISRSATIIQEGKPIYLQPHTKRKEINFDEELIVMFYSVLNYLNDEFHFEVRSLFGYDLFKPSQVKDMIESGKGVRMLRQNRRRYFTDEMVKLWNLLFTFFTESQHVHSKEDQNEQAMLVRDFNLVFEDMIDSLIGDTSLPSGLKEQKDGKIIDHLYRDHSMIDTSNDIYFIGDSKYYKENNEVGSNSIYKQFTYAKNVIQWNMDFYHKHGGTYNEGLMYRDEKTEGYNITPNFFIRGHIDKTKLNDYSDIGLSREGKEYVSYHFENRLFDRDTLILQSYNINFLFVLAAYVQGSGDHKENIRNIFRENIKEVLQRRYQFYALKPRIQQKADQYMQDNFSKVLGKVFAPYDEKQTNCYSLALDVAEKYIASNEELRAELEKYFFIEKVAVGSIDKNPEELFGDDKQTVVSETTISKDDLAVFIYSNRFSADLEILRKSKGVAIGLKNSGSALGLAAGFMQTKYVVLHNKSDMSMVYNTTGSPRLLTSKDVEDYFIVLKDSEFYLVFDIDMKRNNLDVQINTRKLIEDSDHNGYDSVIRPIDQYIM